jgi:hypothetical protein
MGNLTGDSNTREVPAVFGENTAAGGEGIRGTSKAGKGVIGTSESGIGILGGSKSSSGAGGMSESGVGVHGVSKTGPGVRGDTDNGDGVFGFCKAGTGVHGMSETGEGIRGETKSLGVAAIAAFNLNPAGTGAAIYGKKAGNLGHAAFFDGDVHVTRTVTCDGDVYLRNADCAEEFTVSDPSTATPGTVMIIGADGKVQPCNRAYDRRVVGVVSGAGAFKPALILDQQGGEERRPIALMGKVYCLVDAAFGRVVAGDLLTTSKTLGHAMVADDGVRITGTVIGKALASLETGRGLIPILVKSQ